MPRAARSCISPKNLIAKYEYESVADQNHKQYFIMAVHNGMYILRAAGNLSHTVKFDLFLLYVYS
jgi:hypothetical protein